MNIYLKLNLLLIGSIVFGPVLAIYFSFYGDVFSLSKRYKLLENLTDEWELLLVFGAFWLGFYFILSFWSTLKKIFNMPPKLEWWQSEGIYQIYVSSFYDSNGDGIGDLRGVIDKLDYIYNLGLKSIWLSPFYPSGGKDGGYDVTSFTEIDPVYGSMNDFDSLVEKVHEKGMHILVDFVPNHTSNQHHWFKESSKNNDPNNPYRDYYVWYASEDKVNPPNNWKSVFGNSAWTYNENRKAWYLHQFLSEQPDLNFRCPAVRKEIEKVIKFWLETKKVDGLRIDAVRHLVESKNFSDEPLINDKKRALDVSELNYDDYLHNQTADQEETFYILTEWRSLVNDIQRRTNLQKALMLESTCDPKIISNYYSHKDKPSGHFVFNFQLCSIKQKSPAHPNPFENLTLTEQEKIDRSFLPFNLKRLIEHYNKSLPKKCWANWQIGNHDCSRVATRVSRENVNIANALNLLLGGTPIVYYGEEIGMENLPINSLKFEDSRDEFGRKYGPSRFMNYSRDYARTPMQWSGSSSAGFSKAKKTYLPINENYHYLNVEAQQKDENSNLRVFQRLTKLRNEPSFQWGSLNIIVANESVFAFVRKAFDFAVYLVVMNLSDNSVTANLLVNNSIAPRAYVTCYISGNYKSSNETPINGECQADVDLRLVYKLNNPVLTKKVFLKAHDCLILTWPSSD